MPSYRFIRYNAIRNYTWTPPLSRCVCTRSRRASRFPTRTSFNRNAE